MDINHSCVDPSVCVATISFRFYNSFWLKLIYATSLKSFVKLKYTNLLLKAKILSLVTMLSSRLFHSFMHLIENKNLFRVLCTRVIWYSWYMDPCIILSLNWKNFSASILSKPFIILNLYSSFIILKSWIWSYLHIAKLADLILLVVVHMINV